MADVSSTPDAGRPTTIKLSTGVRDRLKAYGGDTYEDTIVAALDALDTQQFWAEADAALVAFERLPDSVRTRVAAAESELDTVWDSFED